MSPGCTLSGTDASPAPIVFTVHAPCPEAAVSFVLPDRASSALGVHCCVWLRLWADGHGTPQTFSEWPWTSASKMPSGLSVGSFALTRSEKAFMASRVDLVASPLRSHAWHPTRFSSFWSSRAMASEPLGTRGRPKETERPTGCSTMVTTVGSMIGDDLPEGGGPEGGGWDTSPSSCAC